MCVQTANYNTATGHCRHFKILLAVLVSCDASNMRYKVKNGARTVGYFSIELLYLISFQSAELSAMRVAKNVEYKSKNKTRKWCHTSQSEFPVLARSDLLSLVWISHFTFRRILHVASTA